MEEKNQKEKSKRLTLSSTRTGAPTCFRLSTKQFFLVSYIFFSHLAGTIDGRELKFNFLYSVGGKTKKHAI